MKQKNICALPLDRCLPQYNTRGRVVLLADTSRSLDSDTNRLSLLFARKWVAKSTGKTYRRTDWLFQWRHPKPRPTGTAEDKIQLCARWKGEIQTTFNIKMVVVSQLNLPDPLLRLFGILMIFSHCNCKFLSRLCINTNVKNICRWCIFTTQHLTPHKGTKITVVDRWTSAKNLVVPRLSKSAWTKSSSCSFSSLNWSLVYNSPR